VVPLARHICAPDGGTYHDSFVVWMACEQCTLKQLMKDQDTAQHSVRTRQGWIFVSLDRQTNKQADTQTGRQVDRRTDIQTRRQTDNRQTRGQTRRQTDGGASRSRQTDHVVHTVLMPIMCGMSPSSILSTVSPSMRKIYGRSMMEPE
jgi:hypothetical protein